MLLKKGFICFSLLLLLSACAEEVRKKPKVFLERDKMEEILLEIHVADAIAEEKAQGNSALEKNIALQGLHQVLANHKISEPDFDSLYAYYVTQPDLLNEMYTNIITEMSKKQAQLAR